MDMQTLVHFLIHDHHKEFSLVHVNIILVEFNVKNVVQDLNKRNGNKIQMLVLSNANLATVMDILIDVNTMKKLMQIINHLIFMEIMKVVVFVLVVVIIHKELTVTNVHLDSIDH
jgi:hypothetical protein